MVTNRPPQNLTEIANSPRFAGGVAAYLHTIPTLTFAALHLHTATATSHHVADSLLSKAYQIAAY